MINCEPMTAKKRAIRIMDVNIIKNSIKEFQNNKLQSHNKLYFNFLFKK